MARGGMDAGQAKPTKSRIALNAPKPSTEDSLLSWAPQILGTHGLGHWDSGRSWKWPKVTEVSRTSLEWIKIHLPVQRTWVPSLVWEDSTSLVATKHMSHSYWAHLLELLLKTMSCNKRIHHNRKPVHRNWREVPTRNSLDLPGHRWCMVLKFKHVGSVPQEIQTSPTQLARPSCTSPDNSWAHWPAHMPSVSQPLFQPLLGSLWSLAGDGVVLSTGFCPWILI